ncbi:hypothetical protein [Bordetella hinzii]|uniref:N-acetyltransferase YedL n=1 Tax=Bordetella hinzii OH87 BAL007II TaxID=1331262 RepID=A0ABR4R6G2_9BORD|nr:hypothetical protein [Bordetella hinzii]KCB26243.1 hypothetical protein L544_3258 [Bordetella hinzii OH87 BAL007II]
MYKLDTQAAKQADSTGGRISEKGKYVGKFTRAEHVVSDRTGTMGIDFDFVTDSGQRARFSIYTRRSDGTNTYGFKQLNAIMTCLGLRELADPKNVPAKVYDHDQGKEVEVVVPQFPELLGKPIGLLLHMEEYGDQGKWRPAFSFAFRATDELMASEILDRKTAPEQLPKALLTLRDKPLKANDGGFSTGTPSGSSGGMNDANRAAAAAAAADLDDIPF